MSGIVGKYPRIAAVDAPAAAPGPAGADARPLTTPFGPVPRGAEAASADHGGAGHVGTLATLMSAAAGGPLPPPAAETTALSPRAQILADPGVQAALARVPGMKSLKLEQLSPRAIALGALSATETAQLIRSREITVTEVVQASIDRAKAGAHLGLIDHARFAPALAQAKAMDAKGEFDAPFAGVPMALKANAKLEGAPTSYGSRAMPTGPAKETAPHLQDYLDLGIVPIFVSTTSEFGFNGVTEPAGGEPTRNPHDPAHTAGGSSGGSAVAVAAGIVPFAHGTDGGGSCRIPAALCGVLGIKPTRRRLKLLDNAEKLPVLINTPGVLARSADDLSKAMLHLDHGRAAGMAPLVPVEGPPDRPLRIAYYVDPLDGAADPSAREATLEMVERLRAQGHVVEEVERPYDQAFVDDFLAVYRLIAWAVRRALKKDPATDHTKLEPFSQGLADLNLLEVARAKVFSAARLSGRHTERYDELFEDYDLLLNPTVTGAAPKVGELSPAKSYDEMIDGLLELVGYTPLQNATGGPAISVPAGRSPGGLPIGLQFAAKSGNDALLLQMAHFAEAKEAK